MNPRAKKKEIAISQMSSLVKAEKAVEKESVLVTIEAVKPMKAQAPTGSGPRTRPEIVKRKTESNCHPCDVTGTGLGIKNRTMRPIETDIARGISLAPCGGEEDCGMFCICGEEEAVARRVNRGEEMESNRTVGDDVTEIECLRRDNDDLEGERRRERNEADEEAETERERRAKLSIAESFLIS